MTRSVKRLLAAVLVAATASFAAPPVAAQESEQEGESPQELAREGAERLMRALEGILSVIPQYGLPEVKDNGDIVIPRLNPPQGQPEDAPKEQDPPEGDDGEGDGGTTQI